MLSTLVVLALLIQAALACSVKFNVGVRSSRSLSGGKDFFDIDVRDDANWSNHLIAFKRDKDLWGLLQDGTNLYNNGDRQVEMWFDEKVNGVNYVMLSIRVGNDCNTFRTALSEDWRDGYWYVIGFYASASNGNFVSCRCPFT